MDALVALQGEGVAASFAVLAGLQGPVRGVYAPGVQGHKGLRETILAHEGPVQAVKGYVLCAARWARHDATTRTLTTWARFKFPREIARG